MKASRFFISTLKEAPADAEIASHKLMMRAGMIKKLGAGIYTYMPLGLRVIRKGLKPDDWVILRGQQRVRAGQKIVPRRTPLNVSDAAPGASAAPAKP